MKIIVLKHALTSGPVVVEAEIDPKGLAMYSIANLGFSSAYKSEYATCVAEAELKVLEMIEKRKAALAKQIKRLENSKPEILRRVREVKL